MPARRETVAWGQGRKVTEPVGGQGAPAGGQRTPGMHGGMGTRHVTGRTRLMQGIRLTLFAAIAAGAVSFVVHSRIPEMATLGTGSGKTTARITAGTKTRAGTVPTSAASQQAAEASVYGYYILSRLSRQRAEAQEIDTLREIADNRSLSAKARAAAAANLDAVARWEREETEIETLLASQGFPQSVVVISNARAVVVVPANGLTAQKAARIGTDVWNLANIPPEEVIVQPHA